MMKLKFRAWSKLTDSFCDETSILIRSDGLIGHVHEEFGYVEAVDIVIQPFIGLKDANRKEIHVGDILASTIDHMLIHWVVEHNGFSFVIRNIGSSFQYPINSLTFIDREIIGNIFQNKDLLKGDLRCYH